MKHARLHQEGVKLNFMDISVSIQVTQIVELLQRGTSIQAAAPNTVWGVWRRYQQMCCYTMRAKQGWSDCCWTSELQDHYWRPVLIANEGRFTPSTCDWHERDSMVNVTLPATPSVFWEFGLKTCTSSPLHVKLRLVWKRGVLVNDGGVTDSLLPWDYIRGIFYIHIPAWMW